MARPENERLKVAMIGSRGMPAQYGGVETVVDVLSRELVRCGHDVTVFCRIEDYEERPESLDGVNLVYLPASPKPGIGALLHSARATVWSLGKGFDVLHYHALGPGLFSPLARLLSRSRVVQTVHGRDDKRAKWGRAGRYLLRLGVTVSARVPHRTLVVSRELADEYLHEFGRDTLVVPNAIPPVELVEPGEMLRSLALEPGGYVISVGRLVPEKAPHELIDAYVDSELALPLIMVGGAAPGTDYAAELSDSAKRSERVMLAGPIYGEGLAELLTSAAVFVSASHLEGLPTAMIEASRAGVPVVASDIGPHREILGADGPGRRLFRTGDGVDLVATLVAVLENLEAERAGAAVLGQELQDRFSADRAAAIHEIAYGLPVDLAEVEASEVVEEAEAFGEMTSDDTADGASGARAVVV